jgi:RNA polymerase sigma factor (sigma-70 family)
MCVVTENDKLIKKIAWSFNKTTGIEFEELLSEAYLAFAEALQNHDPEKAKLSTWATIKIRNHLTNFIKKKTLPVTNLEDTELEPGFTPALLKSQKFWARTYDLSDDALSLIDMILKAPEEFIKKTPRESIGELTIFLRDHNWAWNKIYKAYREIRGVL